MKTLADNTDEHGFIFHINDDGSRDYGDSSQRTFTKYLCTDPVAGSIKIPLLLRTDSKGMIQYVRHWDPAEWPGQLWTMSRDNFKPLLWLSFLAGPSVPAVALKLHNYFTWNWKRIWPKEDDEPKIPDFVLPTIVWGAELRCETTMEGAWYPSPLLWFCDFVDLIGTMTLVIKSWSKPNETSSDLNQINEIIFKSRTRDTWISSLARVAYRKLRRYPIAAKPSGNKIKDVIRVYYWNAVRHPNMCEVLDPAIDKWVYRNKETV